MCNAIWAITGLGAFALYYVWFLPVVGSIPRAEHSRFTLGLVAIGVLLSLHSCLDC